jgi:hypothetical protein
MGVFGSPFLSFIPQRTVGVLFLGTLVLSQIARADWKSDKQDPQTFLFKSEDEKTTLTYKAPFPDAEWIAFIGSKTASPPFALFRGRTCEKCSPDQVSYYITNLRANSKMYSMIPPGKITDPKKGIAIYEGRAFYGQCHPDGKEGYTVFQREHVNKRRGFQKSVYTAAVNGAGNGTELTENLIDGKRRLPRIENTLRLVKQKKCFELPTQNRRMMRTAFDLGPQRVGLKDEEEEESGKEDEPGPKSPDALAEEAARAPNSVPSAPVKTP